MTTSIAYPKDYSRGYSVTPKGRPHIRALHIPYAFSQLDKHTIEVFSLPKGCQLLDWGLNLDRNEWVFIVDVSKEDLDDQSNFVHNSTFDFRSLMRP